MNQIDRLYIFDADATLRVCTVHGQPCPHGPNEWIPIPWAVERLAQIDWTRNGFGVVSNQAGVAKGYVTAAMAGQLLISLAQEFVGINRFVVEACFHATDAGCECRKPKPAMLLDVMDDFGVDRLKTIYIGDLETDRLAAENAGVNFAWIWNFCGRAQAEWWGWLGEQNELHRREAEALRQP